MQLEEILGRFEGVRRSGAGYAAKCPAHDDSEPSLSITPGRDIEGVVMRCHRGCELADILKATDLTVQDLFTEDAPRKGGGLGEPDSIYDYLDAEGRLVFQVLRFSHPKSFRQRRPDPASRDGW